MSDHAQLLPCPFCGKPGKLLCEEDHHGKFFSLGCAVGFEGLGNGCIGANAFYTEPAEELLEAIAKWNTRAEVQR